MNLEQFAQPRDVDEATLAFGRIDGLLPPYALIPKEFKSQSNPYVRFQQNWFYNGIPKERMPTAKPGIDFRKAMRHLSTIQGSFAPKHEHKEAAVAYLASLWLEIAKGAAKS